VPLNGAGGGGSGSGAGVRIHGVRAAESGEGVGGRTEESGTYAGSTSRSRTRTAIRGVERNGERVSKPSLRAGTDRGAGGEDTDDDSGGVRRNVAELRRVEPASEPAGTLFASAGSEGGGAGSDLRGAERGDGGGVTWSAEGGRSVCAAGPGVSHGAVALHDRGQRSGGGADAEPIAGTVGRVAGEAACDRCRCRASGAVEWICGNESAGGGDRTEAGTSGLCDLHLRFHRQPQRRSCSSLRTLQFIQLASRDIWFTTRTSHFERSRTGLRCCCLGDLADALF